MSGPDDTGVTLPPQAVTNAAFPYDDKLTSARRFLESRGIREVRPLYASRARSAMAPADGSAASRAQARWFPDTRCA